MLDSRSAIFSMNYILKTGILSTPSTGNASMDSAEDLLSKANLASINSPEKITKDMTFEESVAVIPSTAIEILKRLESIEGTQRINIKLASLALAGAVIQRLNTCTKGQCLLCMQQLWQAKQSSPLYNLIEFQDRGNLIYPNMKFVQVLSIIQDFVAASVPELISRCNISVILCRVLVKKLSDFNIFECPTDFSHFPVIWEYICKYFVSIILKNFASTTTEVQMKCKAFYHKPLSRKIFKLS